MDVTPLIPEGQQVIETYGDGGFRVSGTHWTGSVLIMPQRTLSWAPEAFAQITLESLSPLINAEDRVQVLLLGCGKGAQLPSKDFRTSLREHGIVLEAMDTGAAARTYNVLMAEERAVAAALIAVQ
ncbi:Mth938-like domain-containing protein [Aquibaculum arenosum]|uniref:Mth938-like domain-containing protein n=1 Tax=Aquibaculum arenosum TaxID=3032591 RepID=A0ABT5YNC9_9PROT|nr:Mth938-like domain-containing protein [Fodinicurvata sp. CAU 1616]MDF2096374.1 Mth938-like domain-containing protein [Fodinicurvata sp. CAU 1616]